MSAAWPIVALGDVLRRSEHIIPLDPETTYKEVTVRINGKGVVERRQVQGVEIAADRRYRVKSGQFIISRIDARHGASGLIPEELDGAVVTNDFPLFDVAKDRLDAAFLGWMSKTASFVELCKRASEGTTNRVRLSEDRFKALNIPLPPLDEQRRIVARIEELAAKVEEAGKARSSTLDELAALRVKSRDAILGLVGPSGTLGDVLQGAPRNGWSPVCDNDDNGTPVLTLSAVTGWRFNANAYKRTSIPTRADAHYWATEGDLLMTRSNTPELVGHAAIHSGSPALCIYPDLMMKLRLDKNRTDTRFVWYWLQSTMVRDHIKQSAKGTSPTMKKISQSIVEAIPFPVHLSVDQQTDIVAKLRTSQERLDTVRVLQIETATELDAMLPAILDKAFKGGL